MSTSLPSVDGDVQTNHTFFHSFVCESFVCIVTEFFSDWLQIPVLHKLAVVNTGV